MQKDWNKYEEYNFIFEIIEEINDITNEDLAKKEEYWMKYYNTLNRNYGYNIRNANIHSPLEEETKEKISKTLKKYYKENPVSNETRIKISNALKGKNNPMYGTCRKVSKQTKIKISKALKGKKLNLTDEQRKIRSENVKGKNNPMYGKEGYWKNKNLSQNTKDKISKAHKGKKMNENTKIALENSRQKRIESGEYFSIETRKMLSEINKNKPKSEEHKQKISQTKLEKEQSKGEKNGRSKITENIVKQIVIDYKNGLKESEIIKKYNLTRNIVSKIIGGQTWTYITGGSLK